MAPRASESSSTLAVMHVIPSLGLGGAECLTADIAVGQHTGGRCRPRVFAWQRGGPVSERLNASHVPASVHESPRRRGLGRLLLGVELAGRMWALARETWSQRIEILHAHMSDSGTMALVVGRALGRKVVVTEHSPSPLPPGSRPGSVGHSLRRRILRWTYRHADAVVAVSQEVAEELRHRWSVPPERLHTIVNGIAPPPASLGSAGAPLPPGFERGLRHIVCVGRLVESKNQRSLVRMLPDLVARVPDVRLVLVGDGPDRQLLEATAVDLGVRRHVAFLGSRTDVGAILAASTCFVTASRFEGTSIALLEAMACGLPVVATSNRGNDEVLGESGGHRVADDEPATLASAVATVLEDAVYARRLRDAARARVESLYGMDRVLAELQRLYGRVLADGRPVTPVTTPEALREAAPTR